MSCLTRVSNAPGIIAAILVASVVASVVVWDIGSGLRLQRHAANRAATKDDVKRIMLAMHQYHDAYDSFPPAFVIGPDGDRWHSWRALILPYLEPELAKQYRVDEPWTSLVQCLSNSMHPHYDVQSLSPAASFISATRVSDREDGALRTSLKKKFPDVNPPLHSIPLQPGQWGIRLYAMIRKTMPFELVFDRFQSPLEFSTGHEVIRVNSFGQDPKNSTDGRTFDEAQVTILDDRGDDNFIVQLETIGAQQDKIILALVPAEVTLEATWQAVQETAFCQKGLALHQVS